MQTIYPVALTPEQYVEQNYQKQVRCPENCPNCGLANSLEVHGYPAEEVADVYLRRWRLELCLDDLKTTLGMETLRCLSPKMVE